MSEISLQVCPKYIQKVKKACSTRYARQRDLANEAKVSLDTVSKFLNGKAINRYNFWTLCDLLELTFQEIIDQDNYVNESTSTSFDLLGRDGDRTALENLSTQHKIVLLKAAAGIGKSTLARHFLETQFTKVIRLEMGLESGNVTPAEEKVSQILRKEFDEEPSRDFQTNLEILREKLSDKSRPIGVLIDNLEPALDANFRFLEKLRGYEDLLRILGDRDVCSFTLITSRLELIVQRVNVHLYSLQGLDLEAWREYFHDCENGATSVALEQMCVAYNGNAKVMDILHGAITNRFDSNIADYWNRYKDTLLADPRLKTLISMEMDWLRDNKPKAYSLLCRMSCYRYQDVKTVPFEGLICLLWDVPESRRNWAVDYLSKSSLVEFKGEYYLHPAIREAAKLRLEENQEDWVLTNTKAAEFWMNIVTSILTIEDALMAFEAYHHYLLINNYNLCSDVFLQLRDNNWRSDESLSSTFARLGMPLKMITTIDMVINDVSDVYRKCQLHSILASMYYLSGVLHKSLYHASLLKDMSYEKDFNILKTFAFHHIGLYSIDVFDFKIAAKSFENVIDNIYKTNKLHRYILTSLTALALITAYLKLDRYQEIALRYIERYYEQVEQGAEMFPFIEGYSLLFIGGAYKYMEDLENSFKAYDKAKTSSIKTGFHQVKAKALLGLGELYRLNKNIEKSLCECHESSQILIKIGAKSDLAEAYFQLGLTYQAMADHDQAKTYKAKALDLFKQMEAPKQIERVIKAFEQGAKQ